MSLSKLDHCSIRTVKLQETRDFYVDILGLEDGDRPDFPFPGNWLYVGDTAVVHLVGVDPDDPSGLLEMLGGDIDAESLDGSGAFDHIAFRADNPDELISRLEEHDYEYFERQVPNMDLFQVFAKDPNGIMVEVNYWGVKREAA